MDAKYRFAVAFTVTSDREDAWVDPSTFETSFYTNAADPGEEGWLFFRDHLWRGEVNDREHVQELLEDALGVEVESAEFRAFETDTAYLESLREEIAADLESFRAETVDEVLSKYLGSTIEVE